MGQAVYEAPSPITYLVKARIGAALGPGKSQLEVER